MPKDVHFYEPAAGHRMAHDPFNAIIAPRPIGWISTQDENGVANVAPYSFFNAFNYTPPIIGFASVGYKDSLRNIEQTGQFCWNLVSESLAKAMNQTSAQVEAGVDEFSLAGLTKAQGTCVDAPYVAEAGVVMECRKTQVVRLCDQHGADCDTWMVFGEVVGIHIDNELIVDGVYQTVLGKPVLRGGGAGDYFTVSDALKFTMSRP